MRYILLVTLVFSFMLGCSSDSVRVQSEFVDFSLPNTNFKNTNIRGVLRLLNDDEEHLFKEREVKNVLSYTEEHSYRRITLMEVNCCKEYSSSEFLEEYLITEFMQTNIVVRENKFDFSVSEYDDYHFSVYKTKDAFVLLTFHNLNETDIESFYKNLKLN